MKRFTSIPWVIGFIAVSSLVLLLTFTPTPQPTAAQDPVPLQDLEITAVLVIDTYETEQDKAETTISSHGQMCVITPTGADGAAWVPTGGGTDTPTPFGTPSDAPLLPYVITSAFHPYQQPHGRMVYTLFETLAYSKNGSEKVFNAPVGTPTPDPEKYAMWTFGEDNGAILFAKVETTGYTTDLIAKEIVKTVDELYKLGIRRFIFNMSFVLLPCDEFPEFKFRDFTDAMKEEAGAGEETETQRICDDFLNKISKSNGKTCDVLANDIDGTPPSGVGGDTKDRETMYKVLRNSEFSHARLSVYKNKIGPGLKEALGEFYSGRDSSSSTATPPPTSDPFKDDPLEKLLTLGTELPEGALYLSIAAAGNETSQVPYAPAVFETVLSVSADYPELDECTGLLSVTPSANKGQVKENGFYNCLAGTSFAAPRLSFEMANFLNAVCLGVSNCGSVIAKLCLGTPVAPDTILTPPLTPLPDWYTESIGPGVQHPPLSYPTVLAVTPYASLDISTAATFYCPAFYSLGYLSMN